MLRRFRIASQLLLLALCMVLVAGYWRFWQEGAVSPLAWFMRLEPFTTLVTTIAARSIVPGAIAVAGGMILLTILLGRFFCGWFCPLGTLIDIVDWIVRAGKKKKPQFRPPHALQRSKYVIMVAMLLLAACGTLFPLFMDPMLITVRFAALLGRPEVLATAALFPGAIGKLYAAHPWVMNGAMAGAFGATVLAVIVFVGTFLDRRFWCQYVCPSGAFLGMLSHFSIVKRISTCGREGGGCGVCATVHCPTRAIPSADYNRMVKAECILCGDCTADKRLCSHFGFSLKHKDVIDKPDMRRRHLLAGVAVGAVFLPGLLRQAPIRQLSTPGPIRPPGAVDEDLFLARCITCMACVNACPNNALHPAPLSEGMHTWNTPELVGRKGWCLPECTRCGGACPTGALEPIREVDKKKTKIGVAVVERGRCRSWMCEKTCTTCSDKCPYEAITMELHVDAEGNEFESPVVSRVKCTGCGACEYFCPVLGQKAIAVSGIRRMPKKKPVVS